MRHPASLPIARLWFSLGISGFLLAACSDSMTDTTAAAERPPVAVSVQTVAPGELLETIDVVGTLSSRFEGTVKAEYSGTIREVYVTEWVRVTKGTLLARFDTREIEAAVKSAAAARKQAEVATTRTERELQRMERLRSAGLATQQNLDDARSAVDAAAAQLDAVRAQEEMVRTRLSKGDVRAPMDGVVASRSVNPGDFIENMGSPHPMFTIVDNRHLELTVSLPSSRIGEVRLDQPLSFTTDAVPGRTFEGRVSFINPAADETSRTVRVVALVENPDDALRSGLFVKGVIVTRERSGVLSVPKGALLQWDPVAGSGVVYVIAGDRAGRREVTTGSTSTDSVEIVSGLAGGDAVVTRGAFNLRDGDRVTVAAESGA